MTGITKLGKKVDSKPSCSRRYVKDVLAITLMIIFYNVYISIAYDTMQYINKYKIIWAFIAGVFAFIPMYAILWITLRKIKSQVVFFAASVAAWLAVPLVMSRGHSDSFNAWQGKSQIFENGELTIYGYFHGLQNPFIFLALYATVILAFHAYKDINTKLKGV